MSPGHQSLGLQIERESADIACPHSLGSSSESVLLEQSCPEFEHKLVKQPFHY